MISLVLIFIPAQDGGWLFLLYYEHRNTAMECHSLFFSGSCIRRIVGENYTLYGGYSNIVYAIIGLGAVIFLVLFILSAEKQHLKKLRESSGR